MSTYPLAAAMCALTARPFTGARFFFDVRAEMDLNRGFFVGRDGDILYACADTAFYKFEVLSKSFGSTFTAQALAQPASVRLVVNGQQFGTAKTQYATNLCFMQPCVIPHQGEYIYAHGVVGGAPPSFPTFRHFGQFDGQIGAAFAIDKGDPSAITSHGGYAYAIGALLPLIDAGKQSSPVAIGSWLSNPAHCGKTIYGIHRAAQVVFVVGQQHKSTSGLDVRTLLGRFLTMGVDDAVIADGSDSATFVVDGVIEAAPEGYKNNSIPTGATLRLTQMFLQPASKLTLRTDLTTDPQFATPLTVTGTNGELSLPGAGLTIHVDSLGSAPGMTDQQLRQKLQVAVPMEFNTSSSLLTGGLLLHAAGLPTETAPSRLSVAAVASSPAACKIMGTLTVDTSRGAVVFDVDWPVVNP